MPIMKLIRRRSAPNVLHAEDAWLLAAAIVLGAMLAPDELWQSRLLSMGVGVVFCVHGSAVALSTARTGTARWTSIGVIFVLLAFGAPVALGFVDASPLDMQTVTLLAAWLGLLHGEALRKSGMVRVRVD